MLHTETASIHRSRLLVGLSRLQVSISFIGRLRLALAATPTLPTTIVFAAGLLAATMLATIPLLPARLAPPPPPDSLRSSPEPTSACAVHVVNDACVAGRLTATTSPGVMSVGVVGPSSHPFKRCALRS